MGGVGRRGQGIEEKCSEELGRKVILFSARTFYRETLFSCNPHPGGASTVTALSDLGIEPTPPLFYVDLSINGVFLAFNSRKDRR